MSGTKRTQDAFLVLLEHPTAADDQLTTALPWRAVGAIRTARSVVDSSHSAGKVFQLSEMRLRRSAERLDVDGPPDAAA